MSPDRQRETVKRGTLTSPQMLSILGGPLKTHKDLIRSLLLATVTAEASADEAAAAVAAKDAAEVAQAVAEAEDSAAVAEAAAAAADAEVAVEEAHAGVDAAAAAAVAGALAASVAAQTTVEAGSAPPGSAAAIERVLRDRLQGSGHSNAAVIAGLVEGLPITQRIQAVLPYLQDPEEGLPPARVAAALYQGFGTSAEVTVSEILAVPVLAPGGPDAGLDATDAASGDLRRAGGGVSASGDDESEARHASSTNAGMRTLVRPLMPSFWTPSCRMILGGL